MICHIGLKFISIYFMELFYFLVFENVQKYKLKYSEKE